MTEVQTAPTEVLDQLREKVNRRAQRVRSFWFLSPIGRKLRDLS
jgi:hypothetical protein